MDTSKAFDTSTNFLGDDPNLSRVIHLSNTFWFDLVALISW